MAGTVDIAQVIAANPALRGQPGAGTALRIANGFVQWKRDDVADWSNLIAVAALTGANGANGTNGRDGTDGRAAELRVQGTALQVRQLGADWVQLFDLSTLAAVVDVEGLKRLVGRVNAGLYPSERPGDTPTAFTASRAGGDPDALAPLDTTVYPVRVVDDGRGVEVSGSREVWERTLHAVETGRLWAGRWRYVRVQNSQDPSGDSVVLLVQWYRSDRSPLGDPVQVDALAPAVGAVRDVTLFIGIGGVTGVTVPRPAGGVYFRVGLRSYGVEARTVITDLHSDDVSSVEAAIRRLVPSDALPNLAGRIDDVATGLAQEVTDRTRADTTLGKSVADERDARTEADAAERDARTEAITALNTRVDTENTRALAAEALRLPLSGGTRTDTPEDYGPDAAYALTDLAGRSSLAVTTRGEVDITSRYVRAETAGADGLGLLYALVGRDRPYDDVLAPLGFGVDGTGRIRGRLHALDFARSERDARMPVELALREGARGTVSDVRRLGSRLISYRSTQDGPSLPYITRMDRVPREPGSSGLRSAHMLDTGPIQVLLDYGQSQRCTGRPAAEAGLTGQGEPSRFAQLFQIGGDGQGRPILTSGATGFNGSAENIIDFAGTTFDTRDEAGQTGVSLTRVVGPTLQRLRDRYNVHTYPIVAFCHGKSGTAWTGLKPGTDPWTAGLKMIAATRQIAAIYGKDIVFPGVAFTHDAGNSGDGTPYATGQGCVLDQMVEAYDRLLLNYGVSQDGGLTALHYYLDQTPPHYDQTQAPAANMDVLAWCLADPVRRHMVGPRHPWSTFDGVHHDGLGYLRQAEVEALCRLYCQDLGIGWGPCYVTGATRSGATITLTVSNRMTGFGDLAVDTTTIEAATQFGFRTTRVSDGADLPCTVSVAPDSIALTLTGGVPAAGTQIEVSHAYRGAAVASTRGHSSCWGNIKRPGPPSVWRPGETIDTWLCIDARIITL